MLIPHQMSSLIMAGPKNIQENIIKELHSLKILHIVEHSKNELADIGIPLENANKLSEILIKVRALQSALKIKKEESKFEFKKGLLEIESTTKKLNEDVNKALEELRKLEDSISKIEQVKQELEILKNIEIPLEAFAPYKSLEYFTGYIKNKNNLAAIRLDLSLITENFMIVDTVANNKTFIVLFIDAKSKESALYSLQKNGFMPVNFTSITNLKGNALSNLRKIEEEEIKLQNKREEAKKKINSFGQKHKEFLIAAEEFLSEQLEKSEAPLKFASTQSSFLIKGWIPTEDLSKSIDRLNKVSKNKIFVHFEPAKKSDKVPIKLKNPKFAKPFEFFIELYSMPTYKEIDPTFFIFLTFPILFGIMLGDVGYGIVSLLFFLVLKNKMPKAKNFFNVLILASLVTVLFGFFFGELFGYEFMHPFISREHDMFTLLYLAIGIGIVHVNLGLIIGFYNILKNHGLKAAIYEKASWFVLETGILVIVLSVLGKIAFSLFGLSLVHIPFIGPVTMATFVGILMVILSLLMLLKGEGLKGLIESISILTNTLSYARLMAIGLSSVILAVIVNESSSEFFHKGGFFVLIGLLILIVGHTINIMLGLLASFLHALRLHYVEFFSKFFHGGAKKYKPFGVKEY